MNKITPNHALSKRLERDLTKLKNWAEKNDLEVLNLDKKDLREWLIDLAGSKLSENSKRRLISALRGFYKFLMLSLKL